MVFSFLSPVHREPNRAACCAASEATKKREGLQQAIAAVTARGGAVRWASKHDLNLLVDNRPHQASASPHHAEDCVVLCHGPLLYAFHSRLQIQICVLCSLHFCHAMACRRLLLSTCIN